MIFKMKKKLTKPISHSKKCKTCTMEITLLKEVKDLNK